LPGANVAGLHRGRQGRHLDNLMVRERGIVPHDMRGKASAKSIMGWGENSPPNGGAEHLGGKIALMALKLGALGRG
jgi:hypothetical protein